MESYSQRKGGCRMTVKRKKGILSVTAVILVLAICIGICLSSRSSEPVNVYSFQYIGMTEFWGDFQESYGPVTTDKIQTEFLSDTQTVTEINIKDGDTVKKGDVLFSFDTTLDALSLERKRLEVEKVKVQIKAAEERLQDTRKMVPYVPSEQKEPENEDLGEELKGTHKISDRIGQDNKIYDGKTKETALICWLKEESSITDAILEELHQTAVDYQSVSIPDSGTDEMNVKSSASIVPEVISFEQISSDQLGEASEQTYKVEAFYTCDGVKVEPDKIVVGTDGYLIRDTYRHKEKTYWLKSAVRKKDGVEIKDLTIDAYPQIKEEQAAWEELWADGIEVIYTRSVTFDAKMMHNGYLEPFTETEPVHLRVGQAAFLVISSEINHLHKDAKLSYRVVPENGIFKQSTDGNRLFLMGTPNETTAEPIEYTITARYEFQDNQDGTWWRVEEDYTFSVAVGSQAKQGEFYVVFKTTQDNYLEGTPTLWQGAKITAYDNGTFDMQLYNPNDVAGFTDHTIEPDPEIEIDLPEIDPNEMYTAEQILDMQKQCYAIIKEQNEKLKLAESEYTIMQRELGDGKVYAEIDGKVVSILTEEEARVQKQPLVKISGGGGFYIEGSVSELDKDNLKLGQEVTVNDWNSGGSYTGKVVSIGEFPSDNDNWNGMGNPTASYYPFKAFVGEEADLQAGSFVSMSYSTASAEQGIYLEKPFVQSEKGRYWIYVRGADGKLEKRDVRVGRVLWGSYYEILSPLSNEDYLAFPYGKHVKPGAPTVESDLSTLYGY